MNHSIYILLRLSLLIILVLVPGITPLAGARSPQQATPISCLATPILGKILGVVQDSNGQPLAGVTVIAHPTTGLAPETGQTNAAGEYEIILPPSSYLLEFRPPYSPLQTTWYTNGTSSRDATTVEVINGTTVSGLNIKLPVGAQFNVAVRDPEGKAIEYAVVSVFDRYDRKVAEGQANMEGQALTTPGLPPGAYRLHVRPPQDSPLMSYYHNQQPTLDAADPLTVTQALGKIDVPITMQRGAQLSGTVTDAVSGAPLAGIAVVVHNTKTDFRYATTDAQGRYSVVGLPSGLYQVEWKANQPRPDSPALLRRLVTLNAPNAQTGFDAALTRGGAISGRVTTPGGAPIPDVSVQVRDIDGSMEMYTSTAADGTYTIYGLANGRYTLAYSHAAYQSHRLAEQVTVNAPNTATVADTILSPGGAISGKVTDPDGKPIQAVYVSVLDAATGKIEHASSYTNATGVYTTPSTLANGSYIVKFQPPFGEKVCPLAIEYSGNATTATAATRVTVAAPATVAGIDAALGYGEMISGKITDAATGLPLYGAVQVYDDAGALVVTTISGMHGHYRTSTGLPKGTYRVQFMVDDYVPRFYGGVTTLEAAVKVPSGTSDINMALTRGGRITGRVTAADTGAPLEYAAVTLYDARDRVVTTRLTDFDGSYRLDATLPSGTYRIGVAPGLRDDGTPYFTGYQAIFSGGATSLAQAQPISLTAPKSISVDIAMPLPSSPEQPPETPPRPAPADLRVYLPVIRR